MTRRDAAALGGLLLAFAVIAAAIGLPAFLPVAAVATPTPAPPASRPYVEGVLGQATAVDPLTAHSQADRDLVSLVFSGLVRLGADGSVAPDLAIAWSVDDSGGTWTFELRSDAAWHDGVPVTADDVVFTVETLQHPDYTGPAAASWRDVTARAVGERTVEFELSNPLAGFLLAATQAIVPAHLLRGIPVTELVAGDFGRRPVGSGPFVLLRLDPDRAILEPAVRRGPPPDPFVSVTPRPTDSLASPSPSPRPDRALPYLSRLEFRFFSDPADLVAEYRTGELDVASGLPPDRAADLGSLPDSRVIRYPGSTLTMAMLNLRPDHPEFRNADVRRGLLAAIDRLAIALDVFDASAVTANGPIAPASWAFDAGAAAAVAHDLEAAAAALTAGGWTRGEEGWSAPPVEAPLAIEILTPEAGTNVRAAATASLVAAGWRELGLDVEIVELAPADYAARVRAGEFDAAVADVNLGLDPDLYPLLASSQVTTRGTNLIGLQDPALDDLLEAARSPGDETARAAAYTAIQERFGTQHYFLPLVYADEVVVARDRLSGPTIRQLGDPSDRFWDVLTWRLADGQ
jgi:peptide/nickel transport system substrate-binding protein